jgi:O-methyltransferase
MAEIISILREKGLEPKRLQMVHSFVEGEAKLFLLEAVRGASVELRILPPLILYREKGVYTKELLEIYGVGAS